jgi:undecaprenyl-diphosphatase
MSLLQAVVLGFVQGLTEFIPISSSGHLVIVPELLGWEPSGLAFDVLLHIGSLLALLIYFSGELLDLVRGIFSGDREQRRLFWLLVVGTIPAVAVALAFASYFEDAFDDASAAAIQLLFTAVILVAAEQFLRFHERRTAEQGSRLRGMKDFNLTDAAVVGAGQAVAILPGISRSGSTIAAGLGLGFERDDSARFSFLLAIPALLGAALEQTPEISNSSLGLGAGIAGFLASLIASYAAIAGLIRYLRSNTLYPFAVYCLVAGVIFYLLV